MAKKSIKDLQKKDLEGKKVLMRADFNVPLDGTTITDDSRITETLPSIKYLISNGAKLILVSHLGRPKNGPTPEFSMAPVAKRLTEILKQEVKLAPDCIGDKVKTLVNGMKNGDVLLLENVRFYKEEEKNDPEFAKKLASLADIYVNDAFGTAHRAHASTEGVTHTLPAYAGLLIEKELTYFGKALSEPKRPFVAIIGGSKVSSKIEVLKSMLDKVDTLLIGGGMSYTFYKALGYNVGKSICEVDYIETAKEIMSLAKEKNVELLLPTDILVADDFSADAKTKVVDFKAIPDGWEGLDIGPKSIETYVNVIKKAGTVIWNGPVGVFEIDQFAKGTFAIAKALADGKAISIIGGGDSAAAIKKAGLVDKIDHISTGGGASLELLEGKILPGISALLDK
ncbi:MAG: phosphoglycerate kinase [Candidatus Margulisbacteria bacterium GWF2_35_9]|nr:MAG: phosphoglycerate kinase [Candidatus Margulisbacteria bacterium GWF2_35_9]